MTFQTRSSKRRVIRHAVRVRRRRTLALRQAQDCSPECAPAWPYAEYQPELRELWPEPQERPLWQEISVLLFLVVWLWVIVVMGGGG